MILRFILAVLIAGVISVASSEIHFRQATPTTHVVTQFQINPSVLVGTGTVGTDPGTPYTGVQSTRLIFGTVTTQYLLRISPAVNVCADSFFRITFKASNRSNTINLASAAVAIGNNLTNYIAYEFGSVNVRDTQFTYYGGWSTVMLTKGRFAQTGTFDCTSADSLILQMTAQAATIDTLTFGEIVSYPPIINTGSLILTFDDGYDSMMTLGLPRLHTLGLNATLFVNSTTIGTAPFTSVASLQAAYSAGDEIDNHFGVHDTLPKISTDSARHLLVMGDDFIRGNSWKRSPRIGATPYGASTRAEDSMFRASNLLDVIRVVNGNSEGEPQQFGNMFAVKTHIILGNLTTLAQAKAKIDTAIARKTTMILLAHSLCTACVVNSVTWRKDDFDSLMTYASVKVAAGTLWAGPMGRYLQAVSPPAGGGRRVRSRSR